MVQLNPLEANPGGWKGNYTSCVEYNGHLFVECIEKHSYSTYDMTNHRSATVKLHYLDKWNAMGHNIHIENGVNLREHFNNAFSIPINSSLDNEIFIWDAKIHLHSFSSPDMIPTIRLTRKMDMESPDSLIIFMKVAKYNSPSLSLRYFTF